MRAKGLQAAEGATEAGAADKSERVDVMREFRVGWAGMLGRVGEGSLPPGTWTAVAMFPSGWPLPFGCLPFHGTPLLGCLMWP